MKLSPPLTFVFVNVFSPDHILSVSTYDLKMDGRPPKGCEAQIPIVSEHLAQAANIKGLGASKSLAQAGSD